MPLSLRPGKPLEFCLESDENEPLETRPTFLSESKTIEQACEIETALENPPDTIAGVYQQRADLLASLLTGWRNMGDHEFKANDGECIKALLNHQETIELIRKIQSGNKMSVDEKKS